MKTIFATFSLFLVCSVTWAGTDYLKVSGWQNCIKSMDQKIYKYFCLPPTKPAGCGEAAWKSLTKGEMLPHCPLCPKK